MLGFAFASRPLNQSSLQRASQNREDFRVIPTQILLFIVEDVPFRSLITDPFARL